MQVIHDARSSADLPYAGVGTIGNYDGIHRGQRRVIDTVVARARELGGPAVVISFEPHPLSVLRPGAAPKLLTSPEQRQALLAAAGVDALLLVRFDHELANTSAESFVRDFLHGTLALQEIYVGTGFVFGHGRGGSVDLLERMGDELGFRAFGVEELVVQGEPVSATRIRRAVAEGRVEVAMELLGRPYALRGKVVRGDRMGMRLGWPTINVAPENECLPSDGVYSCRVNFPSLPAAFDGVTNIGHRPTVYESFRRVVESHILGFSSDVYGETVELAFYRRLREEQLFPSVMDLSAQIRRDVEETREYFASRRRLQTSTEEPF